MPPSGPTATRLRTLHVIVGVMIAGVLVFTAVVSFLVTAGTLPLEPNPAFGYLIYAAVGYLAISLLAAPMIDGRVGRAVPGSDDDVVAQKWITGAIVGMAIREGAALFALVASLLVGSVPWALAFGLISAAGMGMAWPRAHELEERLNEARRSG